LIRPLFTPLIVGVRARAFDLQEKGGVVALKPTTYISGARRHKTNLCLFSTYLQKQKGTAMLLRVSPLQIAYNNNIPGIYMHNRFRNALDF
jgi:hypothetical protein